MNTHNVLQRIKDSQKEHEVMPTGFGKLDGVLDGGFFKKELVVIGAPPGSGKSQLAGQILLTIAEQGFKTAYFSLEISNEMVLSRMLGVKCGIKPSVLCYGGLSNQEIELKLKAEASIISLGDLINFHDDKYLLSELMKEIKTNDFEFVVIDFAQNIMDHALDEYSRTSKVAIEFQKLAKEKDCGILVLSQLSNTAAKEGNRSKNLEYKGSGSLAMVCDLGFLLERNEVPDSDYDPNDGTILTLKKNRRGVSGLTLYLGYQYPGGLIYEK